MKHIILTILFFTSFGLMAQVSYSPGELSGQATLDEEAIVYFDIINELNEDVDLFWTVDGSGMVDGWEFALCDMNTCYNWNHNFCPPDSPNSFSPNQEFEFSVKVRANEVAGVGSLVVNINNANGDVLVAIPIDYELGVSNTNDFISSGLSVFPNPTSDFFQINNDDIVSKVAVHNIIGKRIVTHDHVIGAAYNISDFQKGIYLVRLFDESDNVINVFRLNKN